jgi:hypothetical protein
MHLLAADMAAEKLKIRDLFEDHDAGLRGQTS